MTNHHHDGAGREAPGATELAAGGLLGGLGVRIPLLAAPMAGGPSTPELVLAAARAGGLGFLAGGYKTPEQLAEQIIRVQADTGHFGVNLFVPNPVPVDRTAFRHYAEALRGLAADYGFEIDPAGIIEDDDGWQDKLDLLTANPVPVVSFTFGLPDAGAVRELQKRGTVVVQTVTNADEAEQAQAAGVNALLVQSFTAGGHSGTWTPAQPVAQIPQAELLGRVRRRVGLPMWAAGGVSTHAGVRDALEHGAEAVAVGTVLLRSLESGASPTYKRALGDHGRSETVVTTSFSGRPARALRNGFVDRFHGLAPAGYPAIHHLTGPLRRVAAAAGDAEAINIWAGSGFRDAAEEPAGDILSRLAGLA